MGRRCAKLTFELKGDTHRGIRNKALAKNILTQKVIRSNNLALIPSRLVFLLVKPHFLRIKILIGSSLNENEYSNRVSSGLFALADVDR